ncbi:MAG: F0F1 ATP synthase subunit A [Bacteroidales bacterium]|jgi:F-type H+-transporting ATPase subunit a|nr:F0F1 ATP synthase subunit A [Bacteroidales bacterium]
MAHWIKYLLAFMFLWNGVVVNARHETPVHGEESDEAFQPGEFILDHIGDAYEWHILTVNGRHVSVPLPVILYSKQSGFHVFMSNRLHHGETYRGFRIAAENEPYKSKIVEQATDGSFVRPFLDISITKNVLALFVSIAFLLCIFLSVAKRYTAGPDRAPRGLQGLVEPVILFVRDDIARPAIGRKYGRFMPFLLTVFFFILINNLMGLIPVFPFGANVTGNIAVTLVLALLTFILTLGNSNRNYWIHIFNAPGVPWWLKIPLPLMPFIEFVGMLIKPFVLMVRLFANITAGHIIAIGFFSLIFIFGAKSAAMGYAVSAVSVAFTVFMSVLELLVAFIQAYVFTLLSALYFGAAVEEHHKE